YRPGNTGVMGDYSDAVWIAPDGTPWIGGYDPSFEEGGFSRFVEGENRWENFSNVDYPVIGDPAFVGSSRISDIVPDEHGGLWMGTWRGALYFNPAAGAASIVRYDGDNSPMPGGRTMDVDVAPDGSVWFACYGNGGGLVRHHPGTNDWTVWDFNSNANGWPGWITVNTAAVQPKPGGGYWVWIDDAFGIAQYDSDTDSFTVLPQGNPGNIVSIPHDTARDAAGNVWMVRTTTYPQTSLDYRRPDGTWVVPPQQFPNGQSYQPFRARGDGEALFVDSGGRGWHFDGSVWRDLGVWRAGGFTYGVDMDADGNVWVSGNGGAARRDGGTGQWQRYRVTNTGQIDNWVRDLTFAPNGDVWYTCNAAPGVGGIGQFDGKRWRNHNVETYGLGEDWPFPCDNAEAITYRTSSGRAAFNPTNNGIHEWTGTGYEAIQALGSAESLAEDSFGRLWKVGTYYSLGRYVGATYEPDSIDGWGANVVADPDRPGTVWACANFEVVRTDGTYRYSRETPDLPELNPLHDTLIGVAADRNGVAWLGTTEGLFRLDAEAGTHEWFHQSNTGIPIDQVDPLVVSPDGIVWMTNFNSNGLTPALVWFDGTNYGTITRAEGLPHEQIWDAEVREVPGGYEIWLACASRGLAVLTVPFADPTDVQVANVGRPAGISMSPNPFVRETSISFEVPRAGRTAVTVFDVSGRRVRTLVDRRLDSGAEALTWDGRDAHGATVTPGVYFVRLVGEGIDRSAKVVRVR
ncbi:MAG: T9SS type A sorting domain-containing protein, partial [Gemmatimonadetes bacterium]|nr:T9SS type A sorting domain-containing protein [Gemmatimonadota bacterium]